MENLIPNLIYSKQRNKNDERNRSVKVTLLNLGVLSIETFILKSF